ncbi:MAG: hypothetical protein LC632_08900 [Xanthomonadaceae bacterium]|nr:hypothetical protein [Xanthomonadaceae bacterium]
MNAQRGFSLITAIFLIVVLAALGAFMVTLSSTQQFTTVLSQRGASAYHAARSGIEWGAYRALEDGACAPSTTFALGGGALAGFSVTVTCAASTHTEVPGGAYNVYTLESAAQLGTFGNADFVSRRMRVVVADAP